MPLATTHGSVIKWFLPARLLWIFWSRQIQICWCGEEKTVCVVGWLIVHGNACKGECWRPQRRSCVDRFLGIAAFCGSIADLSS